MATTTERVLMTEEGQEFRGATAKGIVRAMKRAQWQHYDHKRDYMQDVAERCEGMTGTRPRVDSADNFVADLVTCGLLMELPSESAQKRVADRIDGYDRDDLGESPDY